MGRSIKKGPFVDAQIQKKVDAANASGSKKPIKTWSRRSLILPDFVGFTFQVHNGKEFADVFVSDNMVGHKLGEFAITRAFKTHGVMSGKYTLLVDEEKRRSERAAFFVSPMSGN